MTLAALLPACSGGASSPPGAPTAPATPSGGVSSLAVVAGQLVGGTVEVSVAGSALADLGGAVLVESIAGVFLVARTGVTTFSALDAVCSHESCTVNGQDGSTYVCPCHGSRYSRSGQVLLGPATASLREFGTHFADGMVTITL